ncbi:hypothetical protein [uncultured Methanomethylovorans sp.]|uniref:hypothetical protein n=1 Tax=uncultured Methanomethylovorans sp. TaxID=183759 RepID=UPI002AA8D5E2|nr:hypothetical protein [uncultured Methanomethylovorans sp.]
MARKICAQKSEDAVSTVVSAILLLALVVALITSINIRYVPQWTEDAEHLHMRSVVKDMSQLKSGVDLMLAASATGTGSSSVGIPITMGGGEVPFFSSLSSSSTLLLNTRTVNMYIITKLGGVNQDTGNMMKGMGSVDFLSDNDYYPNQRFSYECGGLVIGQDNRSVMKMVPHISVTKSLNDTINVTLDTIKLGGLQRSMSSNNMEEVYVTSSNSVSIYNGNELVDELTLLVETENSMAWQDYLSKLMQASHLDADQYSINSNSTTTVLHISGDAGADIRPIVNVHPFNVSLNVF